MRSLWTIGLLLGASLVAGCDRSDAGAGSDIATPPAPATAPAGMTKYIYQAADGGPHILLPDELRGAWRGGNGISTSDDYARAGKVTGSFGLIPVGSGQGLVLAGSPGMAAIATRSDGRGADVIVLESWTSDNLDALIDESLAALPTGKLTDTKKTLTITASGATLIFAGDRPGNTAYGEERIKLEPGPYALHEGRHKSNMGELVLCRLVKQ
jgi:hypothetical protein